MHDSSWKELAIADIISCLSIFSKGIMIECGFPFLRKPFGVPHRESLASIGVVSLQIMYIFYLLNGLDSETFGLAFLDSWS